jgi:acyl carrier protein
MDKQSVSSQVIDLAAESFMIDSSTINANTAFIELEIDSLDFVDFILNVEASFDIIIPEEEMKPLWTIDLVTNCVLNKLQSN